MIKKNKLIKFLLGFTTLASSTMSMSKNTEEIEWQSVYNARQAFYETNIGKLPDDIMKAPHLFAVWPGGGFYVIPADKIKKGLWVYSTFGLTNSDMPATITPTNTETEYNQQGRVISTTTTLQKKKPIIQSSTKAGYGYEVLLIAKEDAEWPLRFMQWVGNLILINDVDLLSRVEKNNGLTVEAIPVGDGENDTINVLIAKAQKPLPIGMKLPNGNMQFLVATVITDEEMQWSIANGRDALLKKLMDSNTTQISDRDRQSILK
ncbi:suppressor of fused domain protein [Acinetobacter sp. MD2(2019)]|uniref:suppressor of fused domain protein n=1 Tax=Acinetobacter sp. MD2(2019) TaxID=2605273 RepID=UPI002D1E92A0|nr:suppressor of fused domain protein [Acinetobacter sp. MD2(2019)]MEB3752799.1 suppressor of fused domain protein [Acinetobacter sp. MD2(2019)]